MIVQMACLAHWIPAFSGMTEGCWIPVFTGMTMHWDTGFRRYDNALDSRRSLSRT